MRNKVLCELDSGVFESWNLLIRFLTYAFLGMYNILPKNPERKIKLVLDSINLYLLKDCRIILSTDMFMFAKKLLAKKVVYNDNFYFLTISVKWWGGGGGGGVKKLQLFIGRNY